MFIFIQRPVVQSTVNLTISLVVKMLTVIVRTITSYQVFLLGKCEQPKCKSYSQF